MTEPDVDGPRRESAPPGLPVLLAAGVSGAGVMAVELSAVRLVAPWFGTNLAVWTNVLGVVLAALALGYLGGARAARGSAPARTLGWALVAGAIGAVLTPRLAGPICEALFPSGVPLSLASSQLVVGSLAAAAALFLPTAAVLGMVGPLAVESVQRRWGGAAGRASGVVLCLSTIGSLVGTFASTHWLLPSFGVERAFLASGVGLAAAGVLVLATHARLVGALQASLLVAGAAALGGAPELESEVGRRLLVELDSPYQRIRVVELEVDGSRRLEVNERSDSFQSVWYPEPGWMPPGHYYNDFAFPLLLTAAADGAAPERWHAALLGLGGGSAWRVLEGVVAQRTRLSGLGIELDPAVVEVAREFLDLPDDAEDGRGLQVASGVDARAGLRASDGGFDQIVVDTYANQTEIPPHLATLEFMRLARERLVDGGWLTVNVGSFGLDDPLLDALARTAAAAFERPVLALQVPYARNVTLFVRRGHDVPAPDSDLWSIEAPGLTPPLVARVHPALWRWFEPTDQPLVDRRSPTPTLQARSIARAERVPLPSAEQGRVWLEQWGSGGLSVEAARALGRELDGLGDLNGARAVTVAGLELDPREPELLLRAAAMALALGRPESAADELDRLAAVLDAPGGVPESARDWWTARLEENRAWLEAEVEQRQRLEVSRRNAHTGLGAVAVLYALSLVALAFSGGRRVPS